MAKQTICLVEDEALWHRAHRISVSLPLSLPLDCPESSLAGECDGCGRFGSRESPDVADILLDEMLGGRFLRNS
jgi:hypothetical protein